MSIFLILFLIIITSGNLPDKLQLCKKSRGGCLRTFGSHTASANSGNDDGPDQKTE
jgi:hypothetical protein